MSKDICFIEITFENIDYIRIPADYFRAFNTENINSVMFELNPEANRDADGFDGDVHRIHVEGETLFDRLQMQDITHFKLIYADQTEEEFFVPWENADNGGYANRLQTSSIDGSGIFRVSICK